MAAVKTEFKEFIANDIKKYEGVRLGLKKAPIKILNLVHEEDIVNIIERSKNDKRVTIDLNELVFVNEAECPAEKKLPFPASRRYRERIRLGFPALCRFLQAHGYDVWVFTSDFCSVDPIALDTTPADWSASVQDTVKKIEDNEKQQGH